MGGERLKPDGRGLHLVAASGLEGEPVLKKQVQPFEDPVALVVVLGVFEKAADRAELTVDVFDVRNDVSGGHAGRSHSSGPVDV